MDLEFGVVQPIGSPAHRERRCQADLGRAELVCAEIEAETKMLQDRLAGIESNVARMENLTKRLSDTYLDLDLLDLDLLFDIRRTKMFVSRTRESAREQYESAPVCKH